MAVVISRVVLGVLAALAVIGGAMLAIMVIAYFSPVDEYLWILNEVGGWSYWASFFAIWVYVAGAFRAHIALRIAAGFFAALGAMGVAVVFASVISLLGDPGGERGTLQDGVPGFIWLILGLLFGWLILSRRWPYPQHAPEGELDL